MSSPTELNIEQVMTDIPHTLPVLPLRGVVAFPLVIIPLTVGQPHSIQLIDDIMQKDRMLMLVTQRDESVEVAGPDDLYRIGTVGLIYRLMRMADSTLRVMVQGVERARLIDFTTQDPYLIARLESFPEKTVASVELEGLRIAILNLLKKLVGLIEELTEEVIIALQGVIEARQFVYLVTLTVPMSTNIRQKILELDSTETKLNWLVELLQHELTVREMGRKIVSETQQRMSKAQRDYFLHEQLRSIQKELGEEDQTEANELQQRLKEAHLLEEAQKEVDMELNRLRNIPPASPEHGIIRTYLDWMASLPWSKLSGGDIDVRYARHVLDEDHYDLDKVKERIIEYLAVKKLRQKRAKQVNQIANLPSDSNAPAESTTPRPNVASAIEEASVHEPILCFVEPPGVGKTSLGQSIARALGRKFVRLSLGGIHDEAEIRGHRRTYIGAMPGRIIQAVRRAGTRDAVIMLDEIDKVGADWRGDPSSALLEVLDPAQNSSFVDNYLGVAFDLSQILFITTANTLDTISGPLLDRMEILRLSGYMDDEKVHIAEKYLIPKQLAAHGLNVDELAFDPDAIRLIVRFYTREAGVRNLDREIATICRKFAKEIAEGRTEPMQVTAQQVQTYLGRARFFDEAAERTSRPGIAIGLAWTPTGGEVLFVEATMMSSRNEQLILTGMLGDVMRESAQAALSYIRSNAESFGLNANALEGKTIHLHVPAGAIPKDGPSAGVTMTTALASLISGRPVRKDLAMTGEITLRGKVLPVGGIKEKILAAHRAGIKTVILPKHNEVDLEDIPSELRQELKYQFVDTIEEILQDALEPISFHTSS